MQINWPRLRGFLFSGILALLADILLFELLILLASEYVSVAIARLISISFAMVVGWQCHRRITFAISTKATFKEFFSYAALAWLSVATNYIVFLLLLRQFQTLPSAMAIVFASLVAMIVSYLGMRFGVFRKALRR